MNHSLSGPNAAMDLAPPLTYTVFPTRRKTSVTDMTPKVDDSRLSRAR